MGKILQNRTKKFCHCVSKIDDFKEDVYGLFVKSLWKIKLNRDKNLTNKNLLMLCELIIKITFMLLTQLFTNTLKGRGRLF